MLYTLFIVLIVIASILMCFFVLIQESKGGGLASGFAGGNSVMGVRKTTDFLEKTTWGLAIALVVISIAAAYSIPAATGESSVMTEEATESSNTNPNTIPGMPANQAPAQGAPAQAPATPAK